MLYAFGSNGSGQLGVGHSEDLSKPGAVSIQDAQLSWRVKQLAAGGNHTIILCIDGKLRATGNNEDGRCGIHRIPQTSRYMEVPLPSSETSNQILTVKQVSATWSSTAVLLSDGSMYTCGSGDSGELGLGLKITKAHEWQLVPHFPPPGTKVVHLTSSMGHTVAVLSNGEVYGWGKGRKGQLGESAENVWSPRRVTSIDFEATEAVCGKDFTFLVGKEVAGQIAVLGPKGMDRFQIKANAPGKLSDWKTIAASWGSIFALHASGDTTAWGRDDHGQLPPRALPEIEAIAAGSEHCLALTRAGKVLAWGWGEHGNCGVPTDTGGDVKGDWNEIEVLGTVSRIFAGCATSFIETFE